MFLKLMYITNNEKLAKIADECGIDWIFIDLEIKGKIERQGHLDTVISNHSLNDISKIKSHLINSKILTRINPINNESLNEIDNVINSGTDLIMLPYFKKVEEVKFFISSVNKRVKTVLLLETSEAVKKLDEILKIPGIDYIHVGLNDLHLDLKRKFMFELLTDGTVESISKKVNQSNIKFGFGGFGKIGAGLLPAENILIEHYRLKSEMAILSRTFYSQNSTINNLNEIREYFKNEVSKIRTLEKEVINYSNSDFQKNQKVVNEIVNNIVEDKYD
ncbi:aldolase/citrate lyase family protein [Facklamia sp. P12937]|uniref:aldolase/citrate lyase family protein n=1 Tax=Facklamia sp. P12937 TaxID=3421949 RepID=UPI003D183DA4